MWGDPHFIDFDGDEFDYHALGVLSMATWGEDSSVEVYSCPVQCDDGASADWFPCGASSGVAMAAHVSGQGVLVVGDVVYIDGVEVTLAEGESYTSGAVSVARLADTDNTYKTPGLKLQIEIGGVEVDTWKYAVDRMPTGYLQNVRLTLPPSVTDEVGKGVCLGEEAAPDSGIITPNSAWVAARLAQIAAACTPPSPGDHDEDVSRTAEEICSLTSTDYSAAMAACASCPDHLEQCLLDYCATASDAASDMQADLLARGAWAGAEAPPPPPSANVNVQFFGGNFNCGSAPILVEHGVDVIVEGRAVRHTAHVAHLEMGGDVADNKPELAGWQTGGNFAAVLSAAVPIHTGGAYTFSLKLGNADTAVVYVDGAVVLSSPCSWGGTYAATVELDAGVHAVRVLFVDDGWHDHVLLQYSGPDTDGSIEHVPTVALSEVEWPTTSPPLPPSSPPSPPLAPVCDLDAMAGEPPYDFTCGARIEYLNTTQAWGSLPEDVSRDVVAAEFPTACGACAATSSPSYTPTCDEEALAGQYTCGARIGYLVTTFSLSEIAAGAKVEEEFPVECGGCGQQWFGGEASVAYAAGGAAIVLLFAAGVVVRKRYQQAVAAPPELRGPKQTMSEPNNLVSAAV